MIKFYATISVAWFFLLIIAIINGIVRDKTYKKKIGELKAHQLSSMIFILIIFAIIYIILNCFGLSYTTTDLIIMGAMWMTATIAFEFIFGHYVMNHSWKELIKDYNIFKGKVWPLVLLAELIGPIVIAQI